MSSSIPEPQEVYACLPWKEQVTGTYYQTYGGGGDGGYVVSEDGKVYDVARQWYLPWSVMPLPGATVKIVQKDEMAGQPMTITVFEKAMESGQELKNKLLEAEQENIALKLRVAKLEEDVKKAEAEYDAKLLFEISRNRQLNTQNCLLSKAINKVEEPLHLKLKCVEGERDEYKYQLNKAERDNKLLTIRLKKAERENNHLTMRLEEAERTYSSDE